MKNEFGGIRLYNKRKAIRPLEFNKPIHLVLRLNERIPAFFNPKDKKLKILILHTAAKYNVQMYHLVLNHTHVHTVIKMKDRGSYVGFIREITSKLTLYFSNQIGIKLKRIFDHRPWSRIVNWGKGFQILCEYMSKNERESGTFQVIPKKTSYDQKQLRFRFCEQVN